MEKVIKKMILVAVLLIPTFSFAQAADNQASISGLVEDTNHDRLPGASVQLITPEGTKRVTVTDAAGIYAFHGLDPDRRYTVSASMTGFKTQTVNNIHLQPDEKYRLNFTLELEVIGPE